MEQEITSHREMVREEENICSVLNNKVLIQVCSGGSNWSPEESPSLEEYIAIWDQIKSHYLVFFIIGC